MSTTDAQLSAMQRWMLEALTVPARLDRQVLNDTLLPGPRLDAAAP